MAYGIYPAIPAGHLDPAHSTVSGGYHGRGGSQFSGGGGSPGPGVVYAPATQYGAQELDSTARAEVAADQHTRVYVYPAASSPPPPPPERQQEAALGGGINPTDDFQPPPGPPPRKGEM